MSGRYLIDVDPMLFAFLDSEKKTDLNLKLPPFKTHLYQP